MSKRQDKFVLELKSYLAQYLENQEYRLVSEENVTFKCEKSTYTDFIVVYTGEDKWKRKYSTMLHCYRRIELIERQWDEYKVNPLKIENSIPYTFAANMYEQSIRGHESENISRLEVPFEHFSIPEIGDKLMHYWDHRFKPWLDTYSNINELNQVVNPSINPSQFPLFHEGVWFYKMIIARLAGDDMLEEIYHRLKEIYEKAIQEESDDKERLNYENKLLVTEQLYSKLKKIEPLRNPSLI